MPQQAHSAAKEGSMDGITLVTGASGNLAQHVREYFTAQGATLALFERDAANAAVSRARGVWSCAVDLLDADAVHEGIARVEAELGPVAHALLLAGGFAMHDAQATQPSLIEALMARNLYTAVNVTQALLPGMLERKSGVLVGIGAAAALQDGARMSAYASSKAALAAYLRALDHELRPSGVRTLTLYPMGAIGYPGASDATTGATVNPTDLAHSMWHHIRSDEGATAREVQVAPKRPQGRKHG